ncbi:MAG: hypothetical protein RMI90_06835, partial [Thermoguttaceae bacterium]|nr:hypothetical protein [Thermoguttaceae bacterium]
KQNRPIWAKPPQTAGKLSTEPASCTMSFPSHFQGGVSRRFRTAWILILVGFDGSRPRLFGVSGGDSPALCLVAAAGVGQGRPTGAK